jgi:hypothetical protein
MKYYSKKIIRNTEKTKIMVEQPLLNIPHQLKKEN